VRITHHPAAPASFGGRRIPAPAGGPVWKSDAGTAVHEAGHAVAALTFGWEVTRVFLGDPAAGCVGRCDVLMPAGKDPAAWLVFALAGAAAEQTLTDRAGPWGDDEDRRDARVTAMALAGGDRVRAAAVLAAAEVRAKELVVAHAADIRVLAAAVRTAGPGRGLGHAEVLAALGRGPADFAAAAGLF